MIALIHYIIYIFLFRNLGFLSEPALPSTYVHTHTNQITHQVQEHTQL